MNRFSGKKSKTAIDMHSDDGVLFMHCYSVCNVCKHTCTVYNKVILTNFKVNILYNHQYSSAQPEPSQASFIVFSLRSLQETFPRFPKRTFQSFSLYIGYILFHSLSRPFYTASKKVEIWTLWSSICMFVCVGVCVDPLQQFQINICNLTGTG